MNANDRVRTKLPVRLGLTALSALILSTSAFAVEGLDASGNSKVNNALAKRWSQEGQSSSTKNAYSNPVNKDRVVNIGSRRENNCNVNVGTTQPGQKAPKDVVVTTKDVINVCK